MPRRQPNRSPAERRSLRRKLMSPCRRSGVFYISVIVLFAFSVALYTLTVMSPADPGLGRAPARWRPPPGTSVRVSAGSGETESAAGDLGDVQTDGSDEEVYALEDGEAHSSWEHAGSQVSVVPSDSYSTIDWSIYEAVILSSLEAKSVISSFMEHPFDSVPLVWLIHEDILGRRLPMYETNEWDDLITIWKTSFRRADVVVFPDFSLPMMYGSLDTGNFYVIPESPVNTWAAETYTASHSRSGLRKDNGFNDDDFIMLVIGSNFFYDELAWEYAAIMNAMIPEIKKIKRIEGRRGTFKFVFLCGDTIPAHDYAFQELASRMGLPVDFVKHYGADGDVNRVLLMADLVLYGSFQEEQGFPPLLVRAMSFEIPIIVPSLQIITKYVVDQVNGVIFDPHNLGTLVKAFSLLIEDNKLSALAHSVASSGKRLSKNILASDCVADYAKLLENLVQFPSDAMLPLLVSHIKQNTWAWDLLDIEDTQTNISVQDKGFEDTIVSLEEQAAGKFHVKKTAQIGNSSAEDFPTQLDWDIIAEMEILEDADRREREEIAERTPRYLGDWNTVYNDARKADKDTKFDKNERDEAELEKIGLQLCIYEIYSGRGAWPFLQHGSLYRGISLSKRAQRPRSDDIDAVGRLPILNNAYYGDLLCDFGAMFAIANKVDSIHNMPWIGFQSWRAAGRKVSLSVNAEEVLERTAQEKSEGDVIYFWTPMKMNKKAVGENDGFDFWTVCDILNAGNCRTVFEAAFRSMYGLPENMSALPPMPNDGHKWSTLHSWVMPTPSFLEFVMFSRMFVDSIDSLNQKNIGAAPCILGSSELENKHCYCRVLELLVNVWAYHSARRLVYIDPVSGQMQEQHPIDQRIGKMWVKYFDFTLMKSMDEDLAEEADDGIHPTDRWLWPLTGEVHWSGVFDKEREEKYRRKMDKKRLNKAKLLDRHKFGYKQKSLG
ncbi:uncharacterized protein A4U43_C10F15520 [Asparagus officinalis]|uniref:Glycosyl transferase family 1 domain-containing protein n=1 Tax=Asparagus officinalis TaxID=4686 RepID=A0A5P1E2Z2_ASPOF|nr:uncharacterized protein A4U43_C10F15520 [Asparagus officinalis]